MSRRIELPVLRFSSLTLNPPQYDAPSYGFVYYAEVSNAEKYHYGFFRQRHGLIKAM